MTDHTITSIAAVLVETERRLNIALEAVKQGWAAAHAAEETAARAILEREHYVAALRSIALNTCCDRCQEAALVASAALAYDRAQAQKDQ
jgi:hypothetical protein